MKLPFLPILVVDVGGAVLMIVLSFFSLIYALRLRNRDPQNIVWTYLLWSSVAMCVFAVSRSAGHILKQVLILAGHEGMWALIRPYSGGINSLTFMVVGAVTLFFERTWTIYQGIIKDRQALKTAHAKLLFLNQNLENLVNERTGELLRSEQRYRRIFKASRDMIMTAAQDGSILDINPAGLTLLRLNGCQQPAGRMTDFFPEAGTWLSVTGAIDRQGFIANMEVDLSGTDGTMRRVLLSATRCSENEKDIHFVIRDIEVQRQMREQMAQADKLASIGELSAGIAHEINNPMGIILGYTQLMLRQETEGTQRHEDLKTVEKHVRHCKSIVGDLLNFARTSKPKRELCDIHAIIDDVLHFVAQHSKMDGIRIDRDYDQQLKPLLVDEKKVKQVFINLIMNARHAVARQGTIRIRTSLNAQGDRALISIADTGCGIEPKNLVRIFDPFFTTKPTGEGTGLGLSVSYGIIKNHGGEISVESKPGQGATFIIELPLPGCGPGS